MDMMQEWLLLIELMIASISMEQDQNGKFYSTGDERIYFFLKAFQAQLVGGFYNSTIELSESMAHEAANRGTDSPPSLGVFASQDTMQTLISAGLNPSDILEALARMVREKQLSPFLRAA